MAAHLRLRVVHYGAFFCTKINFTKRVCLFYTELQLELLKVQSVWGNVKTYFGGTNIVNITTAIVKLTISELKSKTTYLLCKLSADMGD